MEIQKVTRGRGKTLLQWHHTSRMTKTLRATVEETIDALEGDLDDVFHTTHRSKLVRRSDYVLLVLKLPLQVNGTIELSEVDVLMTKNTLVTLPHHAIGQLDELFDDCSSHKISRDSLMGHGRSMLLGEVLQQVLEYTYPLVDAVSDDIERLQKHIFSGNYDRSTVEDILQIKQDIIDMRRAMRGHRDVFQSLVHSEHPLVDNTHVFEPLLDDAAENWSQLESLMESIDSLEDANESLLTHDLNAAMKMLTLFSVLLLPAAVIAGVFGINARNMPFIGHQLDFWIIICVIVMASAITWLLFRLKNLTK